MKQNLIELKQEIDKFTIRLEDFGTSLLVLKQVRGMVA